MAGTVRVFHPVAQTSEVHVRYTIDGKQCENVYAYRWNNTVPPDGGELLNLCTEVWNTFVRKYETFLNQFVTFRSIYARNIHVEDAHENTYEPPPEHGNGTGPATSPGVAYQCIKRTGFTGRSHHGAVRFSGFSQVIPQGNHIPAFILADIANLQASIMAPRVGGRFIPALASRKLAQSFVLNAIVQPDDIVDSSKRRIIDE